MSKIDEIKEFYNKNCEDWGRDDIECLLTTIEEHEKSLQEIYNLFGYVDFKSLESVAKGYEIAKKAIGK